MKATNKSLFLLIVFSLIFGGCKKSSKKIVVVYVSEDQVFSQPVLQAFERQTGIKVRAVYDTEEAKSTGVVNRILAEAKHPVADVYWANDPIRAEVLKQKGVLQPYKSPNAAGIPDNFKDKDGYWTGFSARLRVFIVNNSVKNPPKSIKDFVNPEWKAKAVIANPLFGTTTSHMSALAVLWGESKLKEFMNQMKANKVAVSTSNGESADFVASGKYAFSLVDSDDVISRIRQHKPVRLIYPDQEKDGIGVFMLPNAVMMLKGAPHPEVAKKLIDFLLSKKAEAMLAKEDCAQLPLHRGVKPPAELKSIDKLKFMKVDYKKVAEEVIRLQNFFKTWTSK